MIILKHFSFQDAAKIFKPAMMQRAGVSDFNSSLVEAYYKYVIKHGKCYLLFVTRNRSNSRESQLRTQLHVPNIYD